MNTSNQSNIIRNGTSEHDLTMNTTSKNNETTMNLHLRDCDVHVPVTTESNTNTQQQTIATNTSNDTSFVGALDVFTQMSNSVNTLQTLPSSPSLLPLTPPTQTQTQIYGHDKHMHNVQAYFQSETEAIAAAYSHEFQELQTRDDLCVDKNLQHTQIQALNISTNSTQSIKGGDSTTSVPYTKKRKAGTNVPLDLQTKIRLIELAEQYQYDPSVSTRGKVQENGSSTSSNVNAKYPMSGIRLAAHFGLNKSTVSRILKRKDEFKKAYYKEKVSGYSKHVNKRSKFEKLNRLVENWFDSAKEKKETVSDALIREVGKQIAQELGFVDFRASNGWVRSLRNRKEQPGRNMSREVIERERLQQEAKAIERIRTCFPNGIQCMSSLFHDLSIFIEHELQAQRAQGDNDTTTLTQDTVNFGTTVPRNGLEQINMNLSTSIKPNGQIQTNEVPTVSIENGAYTIRNDLQSIGIKDNKNLLDLIAKQNIVETLRLWSNELSLVNGTQTENHLMMK